MTGDQPDVPLVSVVAVCYNQGRFLEETLDSILTQTYPNIELIIMDDCSEDDSAKRIQEWITRKGLDCVFIVHEENQGLPATLNEALERCEGRYLQVVACDDVLLPEKVERQVDLLEDSAEDVGLVYSDAYLMKDDGTPHYGWFVQMHRTFSDLPQGWVYDLLLEGNFIPALSTLSKLDAIREVGGYDESIRYEDYDLWLRLSQRYRFLHSGYVSAKYRLHSENLHKRLHFAADNYWIYRKHFENELAAKKMSRIAWEMYLRGTNGEIVEDFAANFANLVHNNVQRFAIRHRINPRIYRLVSVAEKAVRKVATKRGA